MSRQPTFSEKLTSDQLPFLIMGIGLCMLGWLFFGDLIMG